MSGFLEGGFVRRRFSQRRSLKFWSKTIQGFWIQEFQLVTEEAVFGDYGLEKRFIEETFVVEETLSIILFYYLSIFIVLLVIVGFF